MSGLRAVYGYLKRFVLFWRDFLIGDDWWGAGVALVGLGLTYVAVRVHVVAFWVPVLLVTVSLGQSLWRMEARSRRASRSGNGAPVLPAASVLSSGEGIRVT